MLVGTIVTCVAVTGTCQTVAGPVRVRNGGVVCSTYMTGGKAAFERQKALDAEEMAAGKGGPKELLSGYTVCVTNWVPIIPKVTTLEDLCYEYDWIGRVGLERHTRAVAAGWSFNVWCKVIGLGVGATAALAAAGLRRLGYGRGQEGGRAIVGWRTFFLQSWRDCSLVM